MAWTYRGFTSGTADFNDSDFTLAAPAGLAVGDLMVVGVVVNILETFVNITAPANWTSIRREILFDTNVLETFYKINNGDAFPITFSWSTTGTANGSGFCIAYAGQLRRAGVAALDVVDGQSSNTDISLQHPAVTTTRSGDLLLAVSSALNEAGTRAEPGGYTFLGEANISDTRVGVAHKLDVPLGVQAAVATTIGANPIDSVHARQHIAFKRAISNQAVI